MIKLVVITFAGWEMVTPPAIGLEEQVWTFYSADIKLVPRLHRFTQLRKLLTVYIAPMSSEGPSQMLQ